MKATIKRKVFLKEELYTTNQAGLVVMCTETTCNYSSKNFKGVVMEAKEFAIGEYAKDWYTKSFEEFKKQ